MDLAAAARILPLVARLADRLPAPEGIALKRLHTDPYTAAELLEQGVQSALQDVLRSIDTAHTAEPVGYAYANLTGVRSAVTAALNAVGRDDTARAVRQLESGWDQLLIAAEPIGGRPQRFDGDLDGPRDPAPATVVNASTGRSLGTVSGAYRVQPQP